MNFEQLQNQWQQQNKEDTMIIDTSILLKEVQRNKKQFDAMIFWRDVREVGIAFVMIPVFSWFAIHDNALTLLFPAAACLFVGAYMLIKRKRFKKEYPDLGHNATLSECVVYSLAHVNYQIWLLKNVFWWYLLPFILGISVFWIWVAWIARSSIYALLFIAGCFIFMFLLDLWVYRLNQKAIAEELQPRKDELEALLKNINNSVEE
jgi:hypothetical protein